MDFLVAEIHGLEGLVEALDVPLTEVQLTSTRRGGLDFRSSARAVPALAPCGGGCVPTLLVDDDAFTWRRVEYDVERTVARIAEIPDLDPSHGVRLRRGV